MSKIIRYGGSEVTPSDDGRLYETIIQDGLIVIPSITSLGSNQIKITRNIGIFKGRDYIKDEETINAKLSPNEATVNGRIILEMNLSSNSIEYKSEIEPFEELIQENLNENGNIYQYVYCTYKANNIYISEINNVFNKTLSIKDLVQKTTIKSKLITINPSEWEVVGGVDTYLIEDELIISSANKDISIDFPKFIDVGSAQIQAIQNANIKLYDSTSNLIRLVAMNGKPTIQISLILTVRG